MLANYTGFGMEPAIIVLPPGAGPGIPVEIPTSPEHLR
jgi:hypothetical protein